MTDRTQIPDAMIVAVIELYRTVVRSNPSTEMERKWRENIEWYVRHKITSLPMEKFMELPEEMRDWALEKPIYEYEDKHDTDDTGIDRKEGVPSEERRGS